MIRPYPHQQDLCTDVARAIHAGNTAVIMQLPTGGGKTVCFASICDRYTAKSGKRVLIVVHRTELLKQTRKACYNGFNISCEPITAKSKHIPDASVYVAMVDSLKSRLTRIPDIGLIIIDECHIGSFNKVHAYFPDKLVIGCTATPLASSKKNPLKNYYQSIVCGPDIPFLIANGFLCQNVTYAPKEVVDRLELEVKGNDFNDVQMGNIFSKAKYVHNTIIAYEKWCKGKKTIVFNCNIFHSTEVAKAFVEAGYNCRHFDSENTSDAERTDVLQWFANTPDAILCNVAIATTGFDEPSIECVIVNKATQSMPLWLQMCGRGSRTFDNKAMFTIVDMGGNAVTHGDWNAVRDWTDIFNNPPKPGKPTAAPVKNCPQCDAIIPAGAKICKFCGYIYPANSIPEEAELGEFVVITKGINIEELIKKNEDRKLYYTFFEIGRKIAKDAKKVIPEMSDTYAAFVIEKYFELAREWSNRHKKRFNDWHKNTATEYITDELHRLYPKWKSEKYPIKAVEPKPLQNLQPLENIKNIA